MGIFLKKNESKLCYKNSPNSTSNNHVRRYVACEKGIGIVRKRLMFLFAVMTFVRG